LGPGSSSSVPCSSIGSIHYASPEQCLLGGAAWCWGDACCSAYVWQAGHGMRGQLKQQPVKLVCVGLNGFIGANCRAAKWHQV
jgi:hypothetical protein